MDNGSDPLFALNATSREVDGDVRNATCMSDEPALSLALRIPLGVIMLIICLGSIFGNLIMMISLWREKPLPHSINIIFISLSSTNLALAALGEPLVVASLFAGCWVWGEAMGQFEALWVTTLGLMSMMQLSLISFEQYSRFILQKQLESCRLLLLLTGILVICTLLGIAPLLGWCAYGPEGAGVSNSLKWQEDDAGTLSYIVVIMIIGYFNPLLVIVICYYKIYNLVQSQASVVIEKTHVNENIVRLKVNKNHVRVVQERQLALTITLVILSFFFAWTPYVIVNLLNMFTDVVKNNKLLGTIPALFAKSSTFWWIVIYSLTDKRMLKSCLKTLSAMKRKLRVWYFS